MLALLDPALLTAIAVVGALSIVLSGRLSEIWQAERWAVFGLLASTGAVFVALFMAGGRTQIDIRRFDPSLVAGCFDGIVDWSWGLSAYLNVVLYAPVAFFAALISRRPKVSAVLVALTAVTMELLQNALDVGVCEEVDILRNLTGAIFGTVAGLAVSTLIRRGPGR